jgi:hypothetical protein
MSLTLLHRVSLIALGAHSQRFGCRTYACMLEACSLACFDCYSMPNACSCVCMVAQLLGVINNIFLRYGTPLLVEVPA